MTKSKFAVLVVVGCTSMGAALASITDAPSGQAIVQVAKQESLWQFLLKAPETMEAQQFYALMLSGSLGMLASFIYKAANNQIERNLIDYFMKNGWSTLAALMTFAGSAISAIAGDAFHVYPPEVPAGVFVGWGMLLFSGAATGFGIDAIINKGQKPIWTDEQRKAFLASKINNT